MEKLADVTLKIKKSATAESGHPIRNFATDKKEDFICYCKGAEVGMVGVDVGAWVTVGVAVAFGDL